MVTKTLKQTTLHGNGHRFQQYFFITILILVSAIFLKTVSVLNLAIQFMNTVIKPDLLAVEQWLKRQIYLIQNLYKIIKQLLKLNK